MRAAAVMAARVVLLAGPVVLAFFSGGYQDGARAWAGAAVWALAAIGLAAGRPALGRPALVALAGIGALAAWTAASAAWAPVAGDAYEAAHLPALYAGATLAGALLLRGPNARRMVEPAIAAGALVVVAYALSERLLPGLIELERSTKAFGRLEQPITYWNGLGAIAALGLVVCARLCGDQARSAGMRAAAAAAAAPLGMGLQLTVSRGALFACAAGLIVLVVVARRREQLAAAGLVVAVAALAALAAAPFDGVSSFAGDLGAREREGAAVLAMLLGLMAAAALAAGPTVRRVGEGPLRLPRYALASTAVYVAAAFVLAIALGSEERSTRPLSPGAERLVTFTSNRYDYWQVAARAFADDPLHGAGAAGWQVRWRRERDYAEGVRDAHSLPLQTAAELGLVGLALLATWFAGVALAARAAVRRDPGAAAGLVAGCAVWACHSALDWDFQLPAVTLPAVLLAGALLAQSASAIRGASRLKIQTANTHTAT